MNVQRENFERRKFEDFPAEIFHLIFDYLTGDHILKAFLHLNYRFDELIVNVSFKTIDLSQWTRGEIIDFFKRSSSYLSHNTLSLKLTNQILQTNIYSANVELIFSSLLDINQLKYLFNHLQQLIFIRPILHAEICLPDVILQSFLIYSFDTKIICRKNLSEQRLDSLIICNNHLLRTVLTDCEQISNQILISIDNPNIAQFIPTVRHLKLYIDNYEQQWYRMSAFISEIPLELTLLILDEKFEYYDGEIFSSLLSNLSENCRLHFYLQFLSNQNFSRRNMDDLSRSFQTDFYRQHQANVTITFGRNYETTREYLILVYTSPFSAWKLPLIINQEVIGTCSDYANLTRLILDSCIPDYMNRFMPINPGYLLPNLTSIEFVSTPWNRFNQIGLPIDTIFQQISSRLRHIHFRSLQSSVFLIPRDLSFHTFPYLRSLDITDNDPGCAIFHDLLLHERICGNIFHLNITGVCRMKVHDIKELSRNFRSLQTLTFPMKLDLSYNEQLDSINEFLLISMQSHLHYLHVIFEQDNFLLMSMEPSESQLGQWLGDNQRRLFHVQAIDLNRNEFSVWL